MPFRGHESGGPEFLRDPFARFVEIDAALEADRPALGDLPAQRLAAIALVLVPTEPAEIAAQVRSLNARLDRRLPWYAALSASLRLLLAAILLRHDDSPEQLVDEHQRARKLMRSLGMRWAPGHELIAVLALRIHAGGAPISAAQVERMHEVYEAMRTHHWWLTGPEDFPACALLSARPGTPELLAGRAHEIYLALREHVDAGPGDPLQSASNVLALADAPAIELAARFGELLEGLYAAGFRMRADTFDELAALCFLPRPAAMIVEGVVEHHARLREHVRWFERSYAFTFAANMTFVHGLGDDPELGVLADVKALLDMQAIVAQRG